jgi:hypothetical protein
MKALSLFEQLPPTLQRYHNQDWEDLPSWSDDGTKQKQNGSAHGMDDKVLQAGIGTPLVSLGMWSGVPASPPPDDTPHKLHSLSESPTGSSSSIQENRDKPDN